MNIQPDIESWLTLSLIEGLGDESFRKLLLTFKHPSGILNADTQLLERYVKKQIATDIANRRIDQQKIAATLKWLEDPTNAIITLSDEDYPKRLLNIADPPPLLYLKGQRKLLNSPSCNCRES